MIKSSKKVRKMVGKCVGMHSGHVLKKFNFGQKMLEKGRKTCPGHVWKFSFFGQKMFENGRKICLRFFEKMSLMCLNLHVTTLNFIILSRRVLF